MFYNQHQSSVGICCVAASTSFMLVPFYVIDLGVNFFDHFDYTINQIQLNNQYHVFSVFTGIELWYVAYLGVGMLIFLYAKQLSQ